MKDSASLNRRERGSPQAEDSMTGSMFSYDKLEQLEQKIDYTKNQVSRDLRSIYRYEDELQEDPSEFSNL